MPILNLLRSGTGVPCSCKTQIEGAFRDVLTAIRGHLGTFRCTVMSVPNQRLRNALATTGLTPAVLAERVGVDPKSVERWITQDRLPHPTTRASVAQTLGQDETYFWPALLTSQQ